MSHPFPGTSGPVLPLFVQLNARLWEDGDQWREVSRWVKYQENVEDGGKRWSKPHVPSCSFSVFSGLRDQLERSPVLLAATGGNIVEIVDEVMDTEEAASLTDKQKSQIHDLFSQGVKHKMKHNLLRQMSKTSVIGGAMLESGSIVIGSAMDPGSMDVGNGVLVEEGEQPSYGKINTPPNSPSAEGDVPPWTPIKVYPSLNNPDQRTSEKVRHHSVSTQEARSRRMSQKDQTAKFREYNLFNKKVPKDAEAVNIQVATCEFLTDPFLAFVRLKTPVLLEDFCEISKPTRFLALLLGPPSPGSAATLLERGRALGTLFTDQLFCQLSAYRATTPASLLSGLDTYIEELTVLPPSSWDPTIRLDPPRTTQSLQSRLTNRATIRERKQASGESDREEEDDEEASLFTKKGEVGHLEDESLQFTGRLFGGLVLDVKRKLPWFLSDFTDAFHIQTLASIIYIYLATVTKAITFGGFLGDITDGQQGVLESFMGHMLAGGVFCLLGGQPLTVLGCTGPVLIFEKILVEFCASYGIYYLTMRLWIGLWSAFFCIIIVAVDGSAIVRYFTRFTEEAFAALVGIIFIVESLKKLFKMGKTFKVHMDFDLDLITTEEHCGCSAPNSSVLELLNEQFRSENSTMSQRETWENYKNHSEEWSGFEWSGLAEDIHYDRLGLKHCKLFMGILNHACDYVPDIFFLSVILFCGTFLTCTFLKKFKFSPYFPSKIRSMITDYAVILTIIFFVSLDHTFNLDTPKLTVPIEFKPTRSDLRGWLIPLFDESSDWYVYLLACIPALLLTVLLFMDQQITSVIVNRKEHKLKKGAGYHLDMLIVGIMMGLCSLLGLPWCVAATVLCLGHVDSLKKDTESSAPGEAPQFLGVREQRVTGICVFLLTGLSSLLAPILQLIPMPVLYGVLMYMGVNTLGGMQFIDRLALMLMPSKHQPDHIYLRHVPLAKVHFFTIIQATALAALWFIKSTSASLIFPLMVLALVGFRKMMDLDCSVIGIRMSPFTQNDLKYLDSLMPEKQKKPKKEKKSKKITSKGAQEKGTEEELAGLQNGLSARQSARQVV